MTTSLIGAVQQFAAKQTLFRRMDKRLKLTESISLGTKGFIALVQLDGQEMLVGGAGSSISVLAKRGLEDAATRKPARKTTKKVAPGWKIEAAE